MLDRTLSHRSQLGALRCGLQRHEATNRQAGNKAARWARPGAHLCICVPAQHAEGYHHGDIARETLASVRLRKRQAAYRRHDASSSWNVIDLVWSSNAPYARYRRAYGAVLTLCCFFSYLCIRPVARLLVWYCLAHNGWHIFTSAASFFFEDFCASRKCWLCHADVRRCLYVVRAAPQENPHHPQYQGAMQPHKGFAMQQSSGAAGEQAQVTFWLLYHAEYGQRISIVGSVPALGSWQHSQGAEMTWGEGHHWSVTVEVPVGTLVEYKFVVLEPDGHTALQWQQGNNAVLAVMVRF